ncbi:MAG: hypothetical protein Q8R85_06980 [Bosea sp. (in: a-proteobacteria)]|uniref:RraA family protein n=1 Tax=Bosea sp. (in: a-proteobacteria) TaxID=1871050 RepID=UPI0027348A68|nr:hypothetical protein [Bosea sp. (in: a-proteobacteria)]MDP3600890.1 hypothetical protein [Bosea sp. (in: a-proteobacteria)]
MATPLSPPPAESRPATTLQLCAEFGVYARRLPPLMDFTAAKDFAGRMTILKVSNGREKLNRLLSTSCTDLVVIIDGRHLAPLAVVGPDEVGSAIAGRCRALVVFGAVYDIGKLATEKRMPVYAADNSPFVLRAEGGRADATQLDCEAGLINSDYYLTCDADAIIAVKLEQMQAQFPTP